MNKRTLMRKKNASAWTFTKSSKNISLGLLSDPNTPTQYIPPISTPQHVLNGYMDFHHEKRHQKINSKEATQSYIIDLPTKPEQILAKSSKFLTTFEKSEIEKYPNIYFIGSSKKIENNFQDEEGYFKYVIGDHLAYRYEVLGVLGKGSFSEVFDCIDHESGAFFAVKIIRNKSPYKEMGEYECKILNLLKDSKNPYKGVSKIFDSFEFRGHTCIVLEKLRENLSDFQGNFIDGKVPEETARTITTQIVRSLCFIHNLGLIHSDLKPDNLMFRNGRLNEIEIIDFNSSCESNRRVNDYVQSRPYRAPEIVLESEYSSKIDMWSLGCIIVEVLTGKILFSADNESDLFKQYVEVLGFPNKRLLSRSRRCYLYMDRSGKYKVKAQGKSRTIEKTLEGHDKKLIDFVGKLLTWSQEERMSAVEAASHEWLKELMQG